MNFRYGWFAKTIKSFLFTAAAIILLTLLGYYIASDEPLPGDSKIDMFRFSFIVAIVWYILGWLGCRIMDKLDSTQTEWKIKFIGIILTGPIAFIWSIMEYLKQKKRAKYTPAELLGRKKDIYDFWDWLFRA